MKHAGPRPQDIVPSTEKRRALYMPLMKNREVRGLPGEDQSWKTKKGPSATTISQLCRPAARAEALSPLHCGEGVRRTRPIQLPGRNTTKEKKKKENNPPPQKNPRPPQKTITSSLLSLPLRTLHSPLSLGSLNRKRL